MRDTTYAVGFDDLSPRSRIRETALRLFAANGGKGTSIRAVAEEEAAPIHSKVPQLHGHIATLIHRLLSKNPKDRPPHARKVVEEIRCLEMLVQVCMFMCISSA